MSLMMETGMSGWWLRSDGQREMRAQNLLSMLSKSPQVQNVISGTCGGISLVAIGHPFDTIKVKLQTQALAGRAPLYSGALDCMRKTMKMEGFNGLYKGISSPLVGQMFNNACLFMTLDEVKSAMIARNGGKPLSTPQVSLAGCFTGAVVSLVESPTELFKSKMQLQAVNYSSTFDCVRHITSALGLRGWYQGFSGTALRTSLGSGVFFGTYDVMLKRLDADGERKLSTLFVSGAAAGFGFTLVVCPLDTIKSALMADNLLPRDRQYRGLVDCAKQMYVRHGWKAFMQGLSPSLVRATPGCGLLVVTVEVVKRVMAGL